MRTGELAGAAGVNIQTVRFYERRGILPKPSRTSSGYRIYSAEAVRLIRFIKRAQELGFTLDEIEDLLRLRDNRRPSCATVKSAAHAKLAAVEATIASLRAIKRALTVLLASCERNDRDRECPILEALEAPGAAISDVGSDPLPGEGSTLLGDVGPAPVLRRLSERRRCSPDVAGSTDEARRSTTSR